jgi:hypothetical protein
MNTSINHIKQSPYHHSIECFQVWGRRNSLWKVVVNILNKQSWINWKHEKKVVTLFRDTVDRSYICLLTVLTHLMQSAFQPFAILGRENMMSLGSCSRLSLVGRVRHLLIFHHRPFDLNFIKGRSLCQSVMLWLQYCSHPCMPMETPWP